MELPTSCARYMEFDLFIFALTHTNKGKHDDDISKILAKRAWQENDGNPGADKEQRTHRANLTISNRDTEAFEFA